MDNFKKKFLEEAFEHVNDLEKALLDLENNSTDKELVERIFRAMHSLKGGGAMFGFEKISNFTHNLENVYDLVRNDKLEITRELLTLTLESVDHIKMLLNEDDGDNLETKTKHTFLNVEIQKIMNASGSQNKPEASPEESQDTPPSSSDKQSTYYILFKPHTNIFDNGTNPLYLVDEIANLGESICFPHFSSMPVFQELDTTKCYTYWEIFLSTDKEINDINDVFIFVEDTCDLDIQKISTENLTVNRTFNRKILKIYETGNDIGIQNAIDIGDNLKPSVASKVKKAIQDKSNLTTKENAISSIRVSSDKLDKLMNLVSELVTTQARLTLFAGQNDIPELSAISENVQKLSRQLRDNAFSIVLIPIENMLTRFQRLIRDLSSELNKEVSFIAHGTETELDKTIIESLSDPLMHIIRNSIDHGIETPDEREKLQKPRQGTIYLRAFYSGANVHIEIQDDGKGIDPEFIRQKAIQKGIINADAQLSKKETLDLIFLPGFSTAKNVTDVSGRGVGMDVVQRKIADIRGEVEVDSEINKGTKLTIKLPLTLSIIDGLLVKIDATFYVIPLTVIDKIYASDHEQLVNSFNNVVVLDGMQLPYFYLRDEFELEKSSLKTEQVIVVSYEGKQVGLVVDEVVGEYQAVLKPLGKYYKNQEIISGATILGDGTIALVMDTNKAIKQFSKHTQIQEETL